MKRLQTAFIQTLLQLSKPFYAFLFAFVFYLIFSTLAGSPFRVREFAYFNYLADAFLHGQLNLRVIPPLTHDLSFFDGKYYLYWPPMPAVVLMPFVAVFGVGFSDVLFTILVASVNVSLLAKLLQEADAKKLLELDSEYRAMLVLFFALGTVHATLAPFGGVWFTAQILGFLFVLLAYLAAIKLEGIPAFITTGVLIACAMLTRNHLIFTGIWPVFYLLQKHWKQKHLFLNALCLFLPILAMGLLFLAYNQIRFGSPLELGMKYHQMSPFFIEDYNKYGAFNIHYIPINFYYQYIYYPFPLSAENLIGGSLFLLSPVLFYAFRGLKLGYRNPNIVMWLISILFTSLPIFLLMGTGWVQFGPRYTLDYTVPLLLLTAFGVQAISKRFLFFLVILSILQYLPGIIILSQYQGTIR
ncbi:MAG: hypothetical protein JNK32_11085 [Anaerolineales bacterium]|nr:hypothetical protein [Anaerolineales bacterium]